MLERDHQRRSRWVLGIIAGMSLFGLPVYGVHAAEVDPAQVRASMDSIYGAIQFLLPRSLTQDGLADPGEREAIAHALERVTQEARHLAPHLEDTTAAFLADSLADDFEQARRAFTHGKLSSAAFFVRESVDDCVSCHTRLAAASDAPIAEGFAEKAAFATLAPLARARLAVATRQFDDALELFEAALNDPATPASELDALVTDYLTTSVRVTRDLERTVPVLERVQARSDVWSQLRSDLDVWRSTIDAARRKPPEVSLASARQLINDGRRAAHVPVDRTGRAHALLASRVLYDYLARHGDTAPDAAEAYYELGVAELAIGRDYWHSKSDFHLEQAINLRPHSAIARLAFARLEQEVILGFTGSSGTHIPEDERQRLQALSELAKPTDD